MGQGPRAAPGAQWQEGMRRNRAQGQTEEQRGQALGATLEGEVAQMVAQMVALTLAGRTSPCPLSSPHWCPTRGNEGLLPGTRALSIHVPQSQGVSAIRCPLGPPKDPLGPQWGARLQHRQHPGPAAAVGRGSRVGAPPGIRHRWARVRVYLLRWGLRFSAAIPSLPPALLLALGTPRWDQGLPRLLPPSPRCFRAGSGHRRPAQLPRVPHTGPAGRLTTSHGGTSADQCRRSLVWGRPGPWSGAAVVPAAPSLRARSHRLWRCTSCRCRRWTWSRRRSGC